MTRTAAEAQAAEHTPELRLPRPPGVFRRWLAAHPDTVDWIIVGAYLFGCAAMVAFSLIAGLSADLYTDIPADAADEMRMMTAFVTWPWVLVSAVIVALVAIALRLRRRYPLQGLILVSVLLVFEQGLLGVPNSVALVFLLYAVPVFRSVRAGWVGFALVALLNGLVLLLTKSSATGLIGPAGLAVSGPIGMRDSVILAVMNALWLLAVLMIAINLGNRRRYVEALIDRAHQLAREREQREQLAAAAERSRIAREMHDIVAHSLSVVVTLSEAASVAVDSQPEAAKRAMERASETGRSALVEMRRLLGVLNHEHEQGSSPRAPQPGLSQLHELTEGLRQAGLRVSVTESGVPAGDATQQLAVFRIVQEGLTNALRYAGRGAEARLTLEHRADGTRIELVDHGAREGSAERAIPGSGRGLEGAAERARMFGGFLEAGPHGSGWRVVAEVPIAPVASIPQQPTTMRQDEGDEA